MAKSSSKGKAPAHRSGNTTHRPLNILVFGDSQGDVGPTWRALQDKLDFEGVAAHVVNKAVGGTTACHWAADPAAIAKAAQQAFPNAASGPDYVWYTAGGNDLAQDETYHACLKGAQSDEEAAQCLAAANGKMMACTTSLLEGLWLQYPTAKVGQYNYEVPCMEGACIEAASEFIGGAYCQGKSACMIRALEYWQTIYVDALQAKYPKPQYTGLNILGAVQEASGVPGAWRGHPVLTGGANCDWMVACVHPKYRTPAATSVGTALWDLWLVDAPSLPPALPPHHNHNRPHRTHDPFAAEPVAVAALAAACVALGLGAVLVVRRLRRQGRTVALHGGTVRLQEVEAEATDEVDGTSTH